MNIFTCGAASFDHIVQLHSFFDPSPQTVFASSSYEVVGGTGCGKALNLARLGHAVSFHTLLGNDRWAAVIRDALAAAGVQVLADTDPAGTERHTNLMNPSGERISIYTDLGTFEPVVDLAAIEPLIAGADVVALNIANYCRHLIPLAKKHHKEIWCDIHDYDPGNPYHDDFIAGADVIQVSSEKLVDAAAFARGLLAQGKQLVVVTHGARGAEVFASNGEQLREGAISEYGSALWDTNGAGDAFFAAFLHSCRCGGGLRQSLRMGVIAGGAAVTADTLVYPGLSGEFLDGEYARHFGERPVWS